MMALRLRFIFAVQNGALPNLIFLGHTTGIDRQMEGEDGVGGPLARPCYDDQICQPTTRLPGNRLGMGRCPSNAGPSVLTW
jgi:hypothetical protein